MDLIGTLGTFVGVGPYVLRCASLSLKESYKKKANGIWWPVCEERHLHPLNKVELGAGSSLLDANVGEVLLVLLRGREEHRSELGRKPFSSRLLLGANCLVDSTHDLSLLRAYFLSDFLRAFLCFLSLFSFLVRPQIAP